MFAVLLAGAGCKKIDANHASWQLGQSHYAATNGDGGYNGDYILYESIDPRSTFSMRSDSFITVVPGKPVRVHVEVDGAPIAGGVSGTYFSRRDTVIIFQYVSGRAFHAVLPPIWVYGSVDSAILSGDIQIEVNS